MNRSTLMNYPGNKGGDVIPSGREKADLKLSLPLVENISKQDADWRKNSVEETGKVSERLHVTFKIPLWLIALIVVMIAINIIVLVMLHR